MLADSISRRFRQHDLSVAWKPWDGPGLPSGNRHGDRCGRGWKLVTLTTPAEGDASKRFQPHSLRRGVQTVRRAIGSWWRSTPWGRQVRSPGSRRKRVRRDTSYVAALEVAPGGMVHAHLLVYGEYLPQTELATTWGAAVGLSSTPVVDIRAVDPGDPTQGLREALKYATKGEGRRERQVQAAAAVECAFQGVRRVSLAGAIRRIRDLERASSDEVDAKSLSTETAGGCSGCGGAGDWSWKGVRPHVAVSVNGGWGEVRPPP